MNTFPPLVRPKDIRGQVIEKNGEEYWIEVDWLRKEFGKYGTCPYEEIVNHLGEAKKKDVDEGLSNGSYVLIEKNGHHIVGRYRKVSEDGSKFYSILKHLNKNGVADLQAAGGLDSYFHYPKPVSLIKDLVQGATFFTKTQGDIVLDFFAGSSTTAHAVMQLNAEDSGNRRFIMVQLPEPTPEDSEARKAGFATIADISRKRIDMAGQKIGKGDVGFRAYKLTDTHFAKWRVTSEVTPTQLEQHLLDLRDSAGDDASQDDLLTELLLKLGLSLTETIATKNMAGLDVREVGNNRVLAYVNEQAKPTLEQLRALVDAAPNRLVVLEDAFHGDDQLKTNLAQYAKTRGIELRTA